MDKCLSALLRSCPTQKEALHTFRQRNKIFLLKCINQLPSLWFMYNNVFRALHLCRISVTLISRLLLCYTMLQTIHLPSAKSFLRYTLCVVERPSQSLHEKWKKCRHDCGRLCQALLQSRTNEKDFRFDLVFFTKVTSYAMIIFGLLSNVLSVWLVGHFRKKMLSGFRNMTDKSLNGYWILDLPFNA